MSHLLVHSEQSTPRLRPQKKEALDPKDPLTHQAQKWVAQTFYGTMLKQMRDDPFRSEMMDGGRGGQAFGEMFDQKIAERMTRGTGSKLIAPIVRKFKASGAYKSHSKHDKHAKKMTGIVGMLANMHG